MHFDENIRKKGLTYDAWLNWNIASKCNLDCVYCFHNLAKQENKKTPPPPPVFSKESALINIPALIKTLDKTKKIFRIGFTGDGEPFLVPNIIEACVQITKRHFVSFTTNLTTSNIKEFAEKIKPEKTLVIAAAVHIKELERLNLLDRYVNNFIICQKKGFHIVAVVVAYPPLFNEVEKYRQFFREKGITIKFIPFFGAYKGKSYPSSYTPEELRVFNVDPLLIKQFHQQGKLCNAGYNAGVVSSIGIIRPCQKIHEEIGNIYNNIEFKDELITCPFSFCECPLKLWDSYLFERAIYETNSTQPKV